MISSTRINTSRKCTYLTQSRHGVYVFRWNVVADGKHHQPRISLKTRDYLEAIGMASELACSLRSLPSPTLDQVKLTYRKFLKVQTERAIMLADIDVTKLLHDLAPKSQCEYQSCWKSFVDLVGGKTLTIDNVSIEHIELWKNAQTCGDSTLRKKLRLLSSCFEKANLPNESAWFKYKVKKNLAEQRRAFTEYELNQIFAVTNEFRETVDNWKYYLPRLALLTGCRLNELAQLRVSDIELGSGPSLSINSTEEDKRTKNAASIRSVPINESASNIFKALVYDKERSMRLFEALPYNQLNGYTGKPSKYFSKLCRETLKLKGVSFHSFRHSAVTYLFNSGVKEELIGQLMGHSIGKLTTGKVYMSGFNHEAKRKAMQHLSEYYVSLNRHEVGHESTYKLREKCVEI